MRPTRPDRYNAKMVYTVQQATFAKLSTYIRLLYFFSLSTAVIIWGSEKDASGIFSATSRIPGASGHFVWIGSDEWSGRQMAREGNEAILEGAITVQPLAKTILGKQSDTLFHFFLTVDGCLSLHVFIIK